MRDISWFTRLGEVSENLSAFAVLDGELYFLKYYDTPTVDYNALYRLNSYSQSSPNTMTIDCTELLQFIWTEEGGGWSRGLYAAQGKIWISIEDDLWSYDPVTEVLEGPWPLLDGAFITDIKEYDESIYVATAAWGPGGYWSGLSKFTGTALETVAYEHYGVLYHSLEVFQGLLYWACLNRLRTWDGSGIATVYTFPTTADGIGAFYNVNDAILYVGVGHSVYAVGAHPKLYSWDAANMTYILEIDSGQYSVGLPRVFVLRQPHEMYAIVHNASFLGPADKRVYLIDPIEATVSVDYEVGAGYFNYNRSLIYWTNDDSVWAGARGTKTSFAVARRPETYFLLA